VLQALLKHENIHNDLKDEEDVYHIAKTFPSKPPAPGAGSHVVVPPVRRLSNGSSGSRGDQENYELP
jgi:hypothetical protein